MFRFHGWETANVTDDQGRTPRDIYDLLSNIWCEYTCAPRMRKDWSEANRTLGQCSITAFLAQDLFGGKVYGVPLEDGNYRTYSFMRSNIDPALIAIPAPMLLLLRTGISFCSNTSFNMPPKTGVTSVRKQMSSGKDSRTFFLPQTGQRTASEKTI